MSLERRNSEKIKQKQKKYYGSQLRNRRLNGIRFKRQYPMGNYIVDFISTGKKLIIEIDGGQHNEEGNIKYDVLRTKYLEKQGFKVIRFWNNEVLENLEGVIFAIKISFKSSS